MKKTFKKNMQNSEPRVCHIKENIQESIKCHWYTYRCWVIVCIQ